MSKKQSFQPKITFRSDMPLLQKDKNGANVLMCPFCPVPHPIVPFVPSACGTTIEFRATQKLYRSKFDKNMVCAKCHKGGGDMVLINNVFFHATDCVPGTLTLMDEPKYSIWAKWAYHLRDGKLKRFVQSRYGKVAVVNELTPEGARTGKVLGYFFHRRKNDDSQSLGNGKSG